MAEELTTAAPPTRRQAHKLRTERALQQAALELFVKKGYDETSTDEIAEQSGVSARTFFRYFPTKESVLFIGEYGWFQSFAEHLLAQPESLSDIEAAGATLVGLAPQLARRRKALLLYERAVASSLTLRGGVVSTKRTTSSEWPRPLLPAGATPTPTKAASCLPPSCWSPIAGPCSGGSPAPQSPTLATSSRTSSTFSWRRSRYHSPQRVHAGEDVADLLGEVAHLEILPGSHGGPEPACHATPSVSCCLRGLARTLPGRARWPAADRPCPERSGART